MLEPSIQKNDKKAKTLIWIVSFVIFAAVAAMGRIHIKLNSDFNVHIFAAINAVINSAVTILLIAALVAVKQKKYLAHKKMMMGAMILSVLFLVSYIAHHILSGDTLYGDTNHDGVRDVAEKAAVSGSLYIYLVILLTHILLASLILPFILFTTYRGLTAEFPQHKKIAKITWPIWLYVSITGPILYLMISAYY
jgi:putative membrane protein